MDCNEWNVGIQKKILRMIQEFLTRSGPYYTKSAGERTGLKVQLTVGLNFMLSEKSQLQKTMYFIINLYEISRKDKTIQKVGKWLPEAGVRTKIGCRQA